MHKGPLIILSGPSGCGKSTVVERVLARGDVPMRLSVSATTRAPRPNEKEGVHYYFWTPEQFQEGVRDGAFLEWADVYGCCYGTLRREVQPCLEQGVAVILEIDVQGAAQVRRQCPDAISVFLRTSSWETYKQRLEQRGTETEASLQRRLAAARQELERAGEYDYEIVNDDLDAAVEQLYQIVRRQFERSHHA